MFSVILSQVGKKYKHEWIFNQLDATFEQNQIWAVTGPNGAGKSTVLKVISGFLTPTTGKMEMQWNEKNIAEANYFKEVSFAAPYIELIEEFTLLETLKFHAQFKPWGAGLRTQDVLALLELPQLAHEKELRWYSSGMKQRVKLALALLSNSKLVLLDEPGSNLDAKAENWWQMLLLAHKANRVVVIASNADADLAACGPRLHLPNYKRKQPQKQ